MKLVAERSKRLLIVLLVIIANCIKVELLFYFQLKFFLKNVQIVREYEIKNTFAALKNNTL